MASVLDTINKYYEENPEVATLASKYGLKPEQLEIDPFSGMVCLNEATLNRFLKAYSFTYSEKALELYKTRKVDISVSLMWMDKYFYEAISYHLDKVVKGTMGKNVGVDYIGLARIIPSISDMCKFSKDGITLDKEKIKELGNTLAHDNSNVYWNDDEYEIFINALVKKSDGDIHMNTGAINVLYDNSYEILTVLEAYKRILSALSTIKTQTNILQYELLLNELQDIPSRSAIIEDLYNRLFNEGYLDEVLNNPDNYYLSEKLLEYKNSLDNDEYTETNDDNIVNHAKVVNLEIIDDVNDALAIYDGADYTDREVINDICKGIVESLFGLSKSIYDSKSDSYNQEVLVNSVVEALQNNGIDANDFVVSHFVNEAKDSIKPIDIDFLSEDTEEDNEYSDEIVNDLKGIVTVGVIRKLKDNPKDAKLVRSLFHSLKGTGKDIYSSKSDKYDENKIINSFYEVLKDFGVTRDFISNNILISHVNSAKINILVSEMFNKLPEKDLASNLDELYENVDDTEKELVNETVLKEFISVLNAAKYGSLRNIEVIEKQFNIYCSEHAVNYTEEFINSLPDIFKDKYTAPIIERESTPKQKGQVFNIIRRYSPKTNLKTQKRLYATLAGVGIMSFLFMTVVRLKSPETATESCSDTFERLLSSEMLGNIFGDIKTYFASIAASIGGLAGYVAKDEKEKKSRRM